MLSLANCRELLGVESAKIVDEEMEALRDQLYSLANLSLKDFQAKGKSRSSCSFRLSLGQCFEESRIEVEERAAVMEFDGNLSRDEAERAAIAGAVKDWNN